MKLKKGQGYIALFIIEGRMVRVSTIYCGFSTMYKGVEYYRFEHAVTGTPYDFAKAELLETATIDETREHKEIDF